jgi:hypothetical protein
MCEHGHGAISSLQQSFLSQYLECALKRERFKNPSMLLIAFPSTQSHTFGTNVTLHHMVATAAKRS